MDEILDSLRDALVDYDTEEVVKISKEAIEAQIDPLRAIEKLTEGTRIVGDKFERGEAFLCELMITAETMKEAVAILEPAIPKGKSRRYLGKVIIGTVKEDIHDIGKSIVAIMLSASGFEVFDLGVDVSASTFVENVRDIKPDILAMSALVTTTMPRMKEIIEAVEKAGLRKNVKVVVGGAPITGDWANEIGADGYAADAVGAVGIVKKLLMSNSL